jgi:2-polyprenyl-3-methyl-5-hydroxy-6-metoxy-1,4-benzoquinol methylase
MSSDREVLATAYGSGEKLQTRIDIYDYQRPPLDFHAYVLGHLELHGGERILDVGCGTGVALRHLAARASGLVLVGVDRSPGMLVESRARETTGRVSFAVGDVTDLPAQHGAYDVVLAMHMLYHAADIDAAVGELRRVLHPAGTLLATTLGPSHMVELHDLAAEVLGGARLDRPSARFGTGDDGVLRRHFATVKLDLLGGEIVLQAAGPLVRYLDSARDLFEPSLPAGTTWPDLVDHVERRIDDEIAARGRFTLTTDVGVFVCN